ncbi:hypothetical protein DKM44_02765 [Deinococcus irradiatisoli]|uniref:Peripheral subunit-binding (PSBD) domain-containing protein n=1 Tax=Deinococcus irradiatisoli TaxID=2202254 RepID=A0A2Z3JB95_9DEIO|nr:E3 binding domain-containing protein [Deinococcus irradiatisoli]AWN22292.1 hypothetical protein DKM44_02765 [Deinococcus irradiatisoli]
METIAPLAKVLAEANGIEWRSLHGTGEGGLITENDILGYLARVMSGEEDAPLTPVDPEPSPAELAAYSSPEMLSRAGVEPELAEFLKAQQHDIQTSVAAPAASVPAPEPEPEPEPVYVPDEVMPEPEPELVIAAAPEPEVLPEPVAAHAEEPVAAEPMAADSASDFELEDDFVPPQTPAAAQAPQAQVYAAQPEVAAQHGPTPTPPAATEPPHPAKSGGLLGGLLSSLYRRNDAPKPAPRHTEPEPVHREPAAQAQPAVMPVQPQPEAPAHQPQVAEVPVVSAPEVDLQPAAEALPAPEVVAPEIAVAAELVPPVSAEDRPLPPAPALGEAIEPVSEVPVEEAAAPAAPLPMPAPAAQPSAWAGTYLRRDADLVAMLSAREQLSDMLGELPLTLMVARAAQRHLNLLGVSSLAVADVNGQALGADLSGDLRSGLKALSGAQPGAQAELLILDAGALDLDDLHYPHAITLSIGRVQNGSAALSLNGDLDVQQAARFLAEVSALLAAPVKLLV